MAGSLRAGACSRGARHHECVRQVACLHRRRARPCQPGACKAVCSACQGDAHSMPQGNLDEAERYLKQALREARRAFDSKDAHVAAALNNLAEVYRC